MERQPITETSLTGLRPTGSGGRRVLDCWEQIDTYLRRTPSAELADLFAEPVVQPGGKIVWFAPEGKLQRFRDLGADEQQTLRTTLGARLTQLEEETRRLRGAPDPASHLLAETLERAQQVPGAVEDVLYSVNGSPVLINWSMEPEGVTALKEPLKEFVQRFAPEPPTIKEPGSTPPVVPVVALDPKPPPPAPPLVQPTPLAASTSPVPHVVKWWTIPWWWLLWLLFALLLLAILYMLLQCGSWSDSRGRFCPESEEQRTVRLLNDIEGLEKQLLSPPPCAATATTQAACSTQQAEGSDAPETRTIELGQPSGTFRFVYDTITNPDRMVVSYEGRTLFDTGCVSTCPPSPKDCITSGRPCKECGQEEVKTKDLSYSGKSTTVTVQVFPNCTGLSGTKWQFMLSCPQAGNK